jgi:hypothetical protein
VHYGSRKPVLTHIVRYEDEDDYDYERRAEEAEARQERRFSLLGFSVAVALIGLWRWGAHQVVVASLVAFAAWLIYDEDEIRHRKAQRIGKGLMFPLVIVVFLAILLWETGVADSYY